MKVVESLSKVAAHTVLAVFERVLREEAHVLQSHAVLALQQESEIGFLHGLGRLKYEFILLPFVAADLQFGSGKFLVLLHCALVHERHLHVGVAAHSLSPDCEAIFLVLIDADAEVAFVLQTGSRIVMAGIVEHHVMRTTLEGSVVLHFKLAESLPAHKSIRKFERAVLHQLAVQSAVGSIIDIFEEDAVHGRLHRRPHLLGVHVESVGLSVCSKQRRGSYDARQESFLVHILM